eukprot:830997-Prorocentrum_minimum.AAC.5
MAAGYESYPLHSPGTLLTNYTAPHRTHVVFTIFDPDSSLILRLELAKANSKPKSSPIVPGIARQNTTNRKQRP